MAEQHRQKLDLQLQSFALAGIDAWTPGEGDLALGLSAVRDTAARHGVPVVAANLRCDGAAPFPAARVAERGGLRVGFIGLIDPDLLGPQGVGGCVAEPVLPALEQALAALGPVDGLVVLSHQDGGDDAALAPSLPQGALVVNGHGGLSHDAALAIGPGVVQLAAGSRGKALGLAEISFASGGVGYQGQASEGDAKRLKRFEDRLATAREELAAGISDPTNLARAERQVAFYEREIAELQARLAAAATAGGPPRHEVGVQLVNLGADLPEHPETLARVEATKAALGKGLEGAPGELPASKIAYAGSPSCQSCHPAEHAQWSATAHATAWKSLVDDGRHLDLACWSCHATGAFDPAGPQHPMQVGPPLQGVGCEACHGAGKEHVAAPTAANILRDPPLLTCTTCHDGVNDEGRFDWEKYRPMIAHTAAAVSAPAVSAPAVSAPAVSAP